MAGTLNKKAESAPKAHVVNVRQEAPFVPQAISLPLGKPLPKQYFNPALGVFPLK